MEVIDQDDVFFADLSKRISLLIMDDDDEHPVSYCRHPSASFQAFSQVTHPRQTAQSQIFYEQSCQREQSKGTGVFIPRSAQPRRKNKQTTSTNTKCQKYSNDNSNGLPQVCGQIILYNEGCCMRKCSDHVDQWQPNYPE